MPLSLSKLLPLCLLALQLGITNACTPEELKAVEDAYIEAKFAEDNPNTGFGFPLEAEALATAKFPWGRGLVVDLNSLGARLEADQTKEAPKIYLSTPEGFDSSSRFTIMLTDASALECPDPKGNYRHYLRNGVALVASGGVEDVEAQWQIPLAGGEGEIITDYQGPGPQPKTGRHRYNWLIFREPADFKPVEPTSKVAADWWSTKDYVEGSKLGNPIAAVWFSVKNIQDPDWNDPSEDDLKKVDAAYVDIGYAVDDPHTGFGVSLESEALLTVLYNGAEQIVNHTNLGSELTPQQTRIIPELYLNPSAGFSLEANYTVMLTDGSALESPDPKGNYRHFLVNGVQLSRSPDGNFHMPFLVPFPGISGPAARGTVITDYQGPGPQPKTGKHRYAWLVFREPEDFTSPISAQPADWWSTKDYVKYARLGKPVAAAWFIVQNAEDANVRVPRLRGRVW